MKRTIIALAAALVVVLTGCAGTNGPPLPSPIVSTIGTHVAVMLPLGNETFDNGGMDHIAALAGKISGVTRVTIYDYYQTQTAASAISADPPAVKEVVIGFSCGANASPVVAAGTRHRIDGVFVIQVSEWCGGTPLTGNVLRAQETYNPNCLDTGGLGCGRLVPGPNFNPSNLTFIERPDCHTCSDHDPDAVSDIITAIRAVANPVAGMLLTARLGQRTPGAINKIVLRKGQRL